MSITVDDSTDWPWQSLGAIEEALRCPICREIFTAPVTLFNCAHTFCSLCVRSAASAQADAYRCPICAVAYEQHELKPIPLVELISSQFSKCRAALLKVIVAHCNSTKSTANEQCSPPVCSSNNLPKSPKPTALLTSAHHVEGSNTERPSKFVECPVCQTPVDEAAVNTHLDACLQSASGNDVRLALPAHTRSQAAKAWTSLACPTPNTRVSQRKRSKQAQAITPGKSDWPKPTKLAYSMVSVATLRQICIKLGIPSHGDKATLQRRHSIFVTLHQANQDSARPLHHSQLLKQLESREKVDAAVTVVQAGKMTDDQLAAHEQKYKDDFEQLVKSARNRNPAQDESHDSSHINDRPEP